MTNEAFAPAKLNLSLHVTGQRADGYHLLDSLVVFADIGDRLNFSPGPEVSLSVTGPYADGVPKDDRNLVWQAAVASGWTGHIHLHKALPHGAGIGGGSADAAAVLRHFQADTACAATLGADVPVCLDARPQRMQGIGEDLLHAVQVPSLDMVLVNPCVHVSTPAVFKALIQKSNPGSGVYPAFRSRTVFLEWLAAQRNDLQAAACALSPEITSALNALNDAELRRMSGSGSTVFGIYPSRKAAQTAAECIARANPDWWVVAVQTTGADDAG